MLVMWAVSREPGAPSAIDKGGTSMPGTLGSAWPGHRLLLPRGLSGSAWHQLWLEEKNACGFLRAKSHLNGTREEVKKCLSQCSHEDVLLLLFCKPRQPLKLHVTCKAMDFFQH